MARVSGDYGGSGSSGDCGGSEACKSAGTGPSCLDTSNPVNSRLKDGKQECLKREEESCTKDKLACMKSCVKEAVEKPQVCESGIELAPATYVTRATWECRSKCDRPGQCNYKKCYCLEIKCTFCAVGTCDEDTTTDPETPPSDPDDPGGPDDPIDPSDPDPTRPRTVRNNMRITRSNHGVPIELVYTRHIVSGNVIWIGNASNASLRTAEFTSGGEGPTYVDGVEASTVQESFFDFALAVCEGEASTVSRLWINGDLVLDRTADLIQTEGGFFGRDARSAENYRVRGTDVVFYGGSEAQKANPYMGGDVAYRGLAYLFFRRFPLRYSGGKFPEINVEVYRRSSSSLSTALSDALPSISSGDELFHADQDRGTLYLDTPLLSTPLLSPASITPRALTASGDAIDYRTMVITPSGAAVAQVGAVANTRPVVLFSPLDGAEAARFGVTGSSTAHTSTEIVNTAATGGTRSIAVRSFNQEYYVAVAGSSVAFLPIDIAQRRIHAPARIDNNLSGGAIKHAQFVRYLTQRVVGRTDLRESCVFLTSTNAAAAAMTMHEIVLTSSDDGTGRGINFPNTAAAVVRNIPAHAWDHKVGVEVIFAFYDGGEDLGWIIGITFPSTSGSTRRIFRYSMRDNTIAWKTTVPALPHLPARQPTGTYPSNVYEYIASSGVAYRLDRRTGRVEALQAVPQTQNGPQFYNSVTDNILVRVLDGGVSKIARVNSRRLATSVESVGAVLADMLERMGLSNDEYDTSGLDAQPCLGYKVSRELHGNELIDELAQIYMFSAHFANGALTFARRAVSPEFTVPYGDLGVDGNEGSGALVAIATQNETSQLTSVSVVYADAGTTNLRERTQQYSTFELGAADVSPVSKVTTAVLSATYARQLAEVLFVEAGEKGTTAVLRLPAKYSRLTPSDYLVLNPPINDLAIDWRIAKIETGADLSLRVTLKKDAKLKYTNLASISGVVTPDDDSPTIPVPPALQRPYTFTARWYGDMINPPFGYYSSVFYALAIRTTAEFPPTVLYRNVNGFLTELGTVTKPGHVGSVIDFPYNLTDGATVQSQPNDYLIARFADPSVVDQLQNATDQSDFSDVVRDYAKNVLFVGKEIIQYGSFSVALDGVTVTFRNLFRGRRGTDVYTYAPTPIGTPVVVFDPDAVIVYGVPNNEANGSPVAVSTAGPFNGSIISDTYQVIGDTESSWMLPPKIILRQDSAPTGFFIGVGRRKMFFNAFRRATRDTEFRDDNMYTMSYPFGFPIVYGFRRAITRDYFFDTIFGTPGTLGTDWVGQMNFGNGWADPVSIFTDAARINELHKQNRIDLDENPVFNPSGYNHITEPLTLVFAEPVIDTADSNSWYWMGYWPAGHLTTFTPPERIEIWRPKKVLVF